jgi:hypothetical protein
MFKKLFCKHQYKLIEGNFFKLGYQKCIKCGKEKYDGSNVDISKVFSGTFYTTKK